MLYQTKPFPFHRQPALAVTCAGVGVISRWKWLKLCRTTVHGRSTLSCQPQAVPAPIHDITLRLTSEAPQAAQIPRRWPAFQQTFPSIVRSNHQGFRGAKSRRAWRPGANASLLRGGLPPAGRNRQRGWRGCRPSRRIHHRLGVVIHPLGGRMALGGIPASPERGFATATWGRRESRQ